MDQKQDETNQKLDETTISINHLQSMCMNTHKALVGKFGVSLPIDGESIHKSEVQQATHPPINLLRNRGNDEDGVV